MKKWIYFLSLSLFFFTSCKSQEEILFEAQDVVKVTENKDESDVNQEQVKTKEENTVALLPIQELISEAKWAQIYSTTKIAIYKLDSILIDSTQNEYGRKLRHLKDLSESQTTTLLEQIGTKENYPQRTDQDLQEFAAEYQIELCADTCELSLLVDPKSQRVSFMNLEGPAVLNITELFVQSILNTIEN